MAETLQQEEQRLTDARSILEAVCVPPVLAATLASLQAALAAFQAPTPHSAGASLILGGACTNTRTPVSWLSPALHELVLPLRRSNIHLVAGLREGCAESSTEEPADKRLLNLAFKPARRGTAALVVRALCQEHAPSTHIYSYVRALGEFLPRVPAGWETG